MAERIAELRAEIERLQWVLVNGHFINRGDVLLDMLEDELSRAIEEHHELVYGATTDVPF